MPLCVISGSENNGPEILSSSDKRRAQNFDRLRPKIISRYNWCIENYRQQSKLYFDEQLSQFHNLLVNFLKQVPNGGTKDKLSKSKITEIKRELRYLTKWSQLFYICKATSLSAEINHVFALEGGAIAAIWRSRWRRPNYDDRESHKELDGKIFALKDNWAIARGLMNKGDGYAEDMIQPAQEPFCSCSWQYVIGLSALPDEMLTDKGRELLKSRN